MATTLGWIIGRFLLPNLAVVTIGVALGILPVVNSAAQVQGCLDLDSGNSSWLGCRSIHHNMDGACRAGFSYRVDRRVVRGDSPMAGPPAGSSLVVLVDRDQHSWMDDRDGASSGCDAYRCDGRSCDRDRPGFTHTISQKGTGLLGSLNGFALVQKCSIL